jgi:hypothetical protein
MREQRLKKISGFVLDSLADGYRDLDGIVRIVRFWADKEHFELADHELIRALQDAIAANHVQAVQLSSQPPHSTVVTFQRDQVGDLWYELTPKGRSALNSSFRAVN